MDSSFLKNVLLTSCKDSIGRIWSESSSEEPFFFSSVGDINLQEYCGSLCQEGMTQVVLHWVNPKVSSTFSLL